MNKLWSLLFLLVPILGVLTFVIAPYYNHSFPVDVSEHGHTIDNLFYFILGLSGFVFVGTECALFWFMWRYDSKSNPDPVKYSHGSHTLEVVWTIIPALTLLFIAIYQMDVWADAKMRKPDMPPTAEITGRQFHWDIRYPGADGVLHTADDILRYDGDLHIPVGEKILLNIKSQDVLHSFFLPNFRLKQDVVPGMTQSMWFEAKQEGEFDIVCAELCGWGHYKMKGRITIQSPEDYKKWLEEKRVEGNAVTITVASEEE